MVYNKNILKLILIVSLFVYTSNINAQIIRTVDNKGTINDIRNNTVTNNITAPAAPLENDIWFDPTNNIISIWDNNNSSWINYTNLYNSNGTLTADRTITMDTNDLTLLTSGNSKTALTIRKGNNSNEVGIAFRDSGNNYNAAIVMGSGIDGNLDFYSGDRNTNIDNLGKTLSLHDNNQIEFTQYGIGTFENTNPDYILGVLNGGNIVELELDDVDNQNASEVDLATPIDIDGDSTDETTVQEAIEKLNDLTITGTTGSIFFADTDETPTEDNDNLYWDDINNRLFVGDRTLSGSNVLNVDGTTRTSGLNNSDGTVGQPSYRFSSDSDTGMYRPTANNLHFATGGNEAISIASDQNVTIHNLETGTITNEVVVADTNGVLKKAPITSLIPANAIERTNAAITLTEYDYSIIVTAATHTITLPTIDATNNYIGKEFFIKNITNSDVTISTYKNATDSDISIIPPNNVLKVQSDGTYWNQMNNYNLFTTPFVSDKTSDYILTADDDGSIITFPGNADYTLTIPTGLPVGFNISIYQKDDGTINNGNVTIIASGTTIVNRLDRFITAGDGAAAGIVALEADVFYITGDLKR